MALTDVILCLHMEVVSKEKLGWNTSVRLCPKPKKNLREEVAQLTYFSSHFPLFSSLQFLWFMPINGHTKSHHILTVFFSLPGTRKYQEFLQGTCSQTVLKPSTHLAFEQSLEAWLRSHVHCMILRCSCAGEQLLAVITASPGCCSSSLCRSKPTPSEKWIWDDSEKSPQKHLTVYFGSSPQLLSVIGAVPNAGVFTFA